MKSIEEIRRANLAALIAEAGSARALADRLDRSEAQLAQWKRGLKNSGTGKPRGMSSASARYIEARTGKPLGWLDQDHELISPEGGKTAHTPSAQTAAYASSGEAGEPSNVAPGPDLREARYPVISWVQAGEWSEAVDTFQPGEAEEWSSSPKDLGPHGFILRVKGDSMTNPDGGRDNFPDGILIHVQPEADVVPGDYVVAKRLSEDEATFKKLVKVDGELYLQAINPSWPKQYIKLEPGDRIVGKIRYAGWDY